MRDDLDDSTSSPRLSLSANGRWLVARHQNRGAQLLDILGTAPPRSLADASSFGFVGRELWALADGGLRRLVPEDLRELPAPPELPGRPTTLLTIQDPAAGQAIAIGEPPVRLALRGEAILMETLESLDGDESVLTLMGGCVVVGGPRGIRAIERGRPVWSVSIPFDGVMQAHPLFDGKALAVWGRERDRTRLMVLRAGGKVVHDIAGVDAVGWAVAAQIGHAVMLASDGSLVRVDLRYGRVLDRADAPFAVVELAIDQDARHLVLRGSDGQIVHVVTTDVFRPPAPAADHAETTEPPAAPAAPVEPPALAEDAADDGPVPTTPRPPRVAPPALLPLALGPPPPEPAALEPGESPYPNARAHLDALLDLVTARTAVAIADAWNSGRLSRRDSTQRPHEHEVGALIGGAGGFAPEKVAETRQRVEERQREAATRARASMTRGVRLPFPDLVREFGLSGVAAQVLLLVAAPALRGEIARLYGVLSNDPARPMVDRFLIEQIVAGDRSSLRDQISRDLAADAPLVRHGLVHLDGHPAASLFARLWVGDALLDRLRGLPVSRADEVTTVRGSDRELAELAMPDSLVSELVLALAQPRPAHDPLRLVLRGRRGSGRRTLVAALASRVGREIAAIETGRMPRAPRELLPSLRSALYRASVHGLVPVLSGLELIEPTDAELQEAVRQAVRAHPGPLVIRTSPEGVLPIDPGFLSFTIPALTETERVWAWEERVAARGLRADVDRLASRYRVGPGVITTVVDHVASQARGPGDATNALDTQVRQHVAARLEHVAQRITRVAGWEDLSLPDEMLDSLREFIGRVRHRRTVYERWGYDAKMTTSRGLTALFYGPPGTGKSMVAGVIAGELGLDLHRVDLARVVSKWVGETEKNLSEVFDAAEDGQVLVLFDEADSLFAKRTDVRTSNDRYANLEVNYLLQRLDTFEGVAILTSNLDGAIDPAFKRRLSLRLQFPFPDEEMRTRLWAAHVTPQTPVAGDFDFDELARRFPLSGGCIRNCALRAAFLAAHEGRPLGQEHLLRAIQLEYRELGKLSTSSRME